MLELYAEQERLLMEKANRPASKTTLIVESAIQQMPPVLGETQSDRATQARQILESTEFGKNLLRKRESGRR